ncbi:MAG: M3 family metallopeptidase [Bacteroidales bacterium]|nr:M3 family metallopeptidase [Bacteroidales bacterium]MDD3011168.1 M3 family metallopeptidase [Bacteroidales bacterium]MDD3961821.1 M3 family metallopeptidase [Bacteroidales bacterium]MDY0286209.1 M3 family metallopeptidase [Bacteroidales bacterium]HPE87546.1 M3 family metallopeptidase [Bacteroidales bacterium]
MTNPFFQPFDTPYGVPAFDKIQTADYMPAFEKGMQQQNEQIDAIVKNSEAPTFDNTIAAMDYSGDILNRVSDVFFNMTECNTNEELQAIAREITPKLSKHSDDIYLNEALFERVNAVYQNRENAALNTEQKMLLDKIYKRFVNGGANLPADKKDRFREINEHLSLLSLEFGENLLNETNNYTLVITDKADLAGLPQWVIDGAAAEAASRELENSWVFTLQKPSWIPFLQYSENRELRKELLLAYAQRGDKDNEYDNKKIAMEMVNLRVEKANMLGYETWADYKLSDRMAENPQQVYDLLDDIMSKALPVAEKEMRDMQKMIDNDGDGFKLEAWDWWHYAEKVKAQKYAFNDEALKPYFSLENVLYKGVFGVTNKLWGLKYVERHDLPVYHEEVKVFEVQESDGSLIGILYMDFFPRDSKRGGAWMTSFRKQMKTPEGENVLPVIQVVTNFTKPTGDAPALLSLDETLTLFHEFGHALHGLLSECTYHGVSGTAVPRDFVELPSQILENWATEPEVLDMYAFHYETGETIPAELVEKMKKSGTFNQGFAVVEFMSAALLDMDFHTLKEKTDLDANTFEEQVMQRINMMPEIIVRYRPTYFAHIFSGGYSAGYYSYTWAEVLDADAFEAFKENGLFDQATAKAFRDNVLSQGGSDDAMKLYKQFRGQDPTADAMMKRKGLQ